MEKKRAVSQTGGTQTGLEAQRDVDESYRSGPRALAPLPSTSGDGGSPCPVNSKHVGLDVLTTTLTGVMPKYMLF